MNSDQSDCPVPRTRIAAGRLLPGSIACVLLAGCMTSKVDETRQVAASVHKGESIVVLRRPQLEGTGTEEEFIGCLQQRLGGELVHPASSQSQTKHKESAPFKIYGEQQFVDALFPWFESSTAPNNAAGLKLLLERPGVTERLQQIQVRYVVWIDGKTQKTDSSGSISCVIGPVSGCIGLGWWEKESGYVASVWDLNTATEVGSVTADVTGTSVLIGAIAPIPIITPVQKTACDRLGDQLRTFLVGGEQVIGATAPAGAPGTGAGSR
jgi:hypothetical protein